MIRVQWWRLYLDWGKIKCFFKMFMVHSFGEFVFIGKPIYCKMYNGFQLILNEKSVELVKKMIKYLIIFDWFNKYYFRGLIC